MESLPLMKTGYSLEADMKFGWKPAVAGKVLPIPLAFDLQDDYFELDHFSAQKKLLPEIFRGWRPEDSLKMHRKLLSITNRHHGSEYPFKLPPNLPLGAQKLAGQKMKQKLTGILGQSAKAPQIYAGMNPVQR